MELKQTITFNHRQESIQPFLLEVVRFLETHLQQPAPQLNFKAKVIITELLTNSIKHAGRGQTDIHLSLNAQSLTIIKTDNGPAFTAGTEQMQWPSAKPIGTVTKIYADSLNGLFAKLTSVQELTFFTEDYNDEHDLLADISEHYGLMIICRAADSFTYSYNVPAGTNTFTAIINL